MDGVYDRIGQKITRKCRMERLEDNNSIERLNDAHCAGIVSPIFEML